MTEISYNEITGHIRDITPEATSPVFLVFGEEFLVEQATRTIIDALLPESAEKSVSLETVDMAEGHSIYEIIERISTLCFFSKKKVVRLKASALFDSKFQPGKHLEKIEEARLAGDTAKAANLLVELMARQNCRPEDIETGDASNALQIDPQPYTDVDWLKHTAGYCIEKGLSPAEAGSTEDSAILKGAIERGLPKNHYLIITAGTVDRRKALYKTIRDGHISVDCTVAPGARSSDIQKQKRVLAALMQNLLWENNKTAEEKVFDKLFDLTGFDPRTFCGNVEKLINFSATSSRIMAKDVDAVLNKSKHDPVYAFTGAVADKNAPRALYYLFSMLDSGFHHMQLLSALSNQVRRLLMARFFMQSGHGGNWQPGMGFDRFKKQVMPAVEQYDMEMTEYAVGKTNTDSAAGKSKKAAKPAKSKTDLTIVKNPNNPYPVYQLFIQSARFDSGFLKNIIIKMHEADIRLKTSGHTPKAVLEDLVLFICMASDRQEK